MASNAIRGCRRQQEVAGYAWARKERTSYDQPDPAVDAPSNRTITPQPPARSARNLLGPTQVTGKVKGVNYGFE
ncbi:hypothetical protein [Gimesia maris]|uniref:hypothetical protein n=1 Tax=Gimesia maris TaxID=122 RepID=UPI0012B9C565|nr:hypothetical protein [Gimesia maris]